MKKKYCVAIDLGASSGKMSKVIFDGETINIDNCINFDNITVSIHNNLYWDLFGLYKNVIYGLTKFAAEEGEIDSIGIDTWGATYGFIDKRGRLAEPIFHYRDMRTETALEDMYKTLSKREIFDLTGCQCARSYTLPQLFASVNQGDSVLYTADKLLFLPDLLSYFLSGIKTTEMTIAGTSALLESSQEKWSFELLDRFNIPTNLFTDIIDAGTIKGSITNKISDDTGIKYSNVIAVASHDSASAVVSIPNFGENKIYISMGTNISMGIESSSTGLGDMFFQGGFKNTGGLMRKKIIYRDFAAFWIINELFATWENEGIAYSFDEINEMAANVMNSSYLNLDDKILNTAGGDMQRKIDQYLENTNQPAMHSRGEYIRCAYESIALKVKKTVEDLKKATGKNFTEIFVISGGSRNKLLNQLICDAVNKPLKAGIPYATIAGNALTQLYAMGYVNSLEQIREVSGNSFRMTGYEPGNTKDWNGALEFGVFNGICV